VEETWRDGALVWPGRRRRDAAFSRKLRIMLARRDCGARKELNGSMGVREYESMRSVLRSLQWYHRDRCLILLVPGGTVRRVATSLTGDETYHGVT
jgi:hypothetical protein